MSKRMVTISRRWNNPKVETVITDDSISLTISIEDFATALKKEVGSVTWKIGTIDAQIDAAIDRVLEGVKEESAKVV
jgi:hypothetical protein